MNAIAVAGFGRCGSTMLMTMLDAGGIPPVRGSASGSYELEEVERLDDLTAEELDGHAVKVLDRVDRGLPLPTSVEWDIIWIDRHPRQQARSIIKFAKFITGEADLIAESTLRRSLYAEHHRAVAAYRRSGRLLVLKFEKVLADPRRAADRVKTFLARDLDVAAMAAVVHQRPPECLADCSVEVRLSS